MFFSCVCCGATPWVFVTIFPFFRPPFAPPPFFFFYCGVFFHPQQAVSYWSCLFGGGFFFGEQASFPFPWILTTLVGSFPAPNVLAFGRGRVPPCVKVFGYDRGFVGSASSPPLGTPAGVFFLFKEQVLGGRPGRGRCSCPFFSPLQKKGFLLRGPFKSRGFFPPLSNNTGCFLPQNFGLQVFGQSFLT